MKIENDHPRTVRGPSWVAHSGGRQLAPSITGSGRPFVPTVSYRGSGDLLAVYWGDRETFADGIHQEGGVTLLQALTCEDLLQGCKLPGLSVSVPIKGRPAPKRRVVNPDALASDRRKFRRFCHYDLEKDTLLVRWQYSWRCVERDDDQGGHPLKMILSADRQPEDLDGQHPWRLVGVRISRLSQVMPGQIVGR